MKGTFIQFKISDDIPNRSGINPSDNFPDVGSFTKNKEWYGYPEKMGVSGFFTLLILMDFLLRIQNRVVSGRKFIRAINYHCIPSASEIQFEQHLQVYKKHFSSVEYSPIFQKTDEINSSGQGCVGFK